ncbi:MAG: hypothetical protein NTY48_00905, partial [Candidatus Diapherotrites archaeon]|nr:hypothetical protein [Candidatus Diapherotrites archaeon]
MKYVNKRGFIGPIGDDMPSLVPIVVALLLFFTIFTMTLTSYNNKNAYLRKQTDMTSIARELKGDTLILGVAQFDKRCNNLRLKKIPYNFVSAIYPTNIDINVV